MPPLIETLPRPVWQERQHQHFQRVSAWTGPHRDRAARGEKHPVWDFLFEYYGFRPAWLERWHPGPGVLLAGAELGAAFAAPAYGGAGGGVHLGNPEVSRVPFIRWLLELLENIEGRPALFGCHGLHEWAMVYRLDPAAVRHRQLALRLPSEAIAAVVEQLPLRCTHFDAFRFFTEPARPLNRVQPSRPDVPRLEQAGCLHANMDLYKWAFKLSPYAPAELIADCFELARDIRAVDMRASPYDLSALGFAPLPIETAAGRADYEQAQRGFSARSAPLRTRLIALCRRLLQAGGEPSGSVSDAGSASCSSAPLRHAEEAQLSGR